MPRMGAQPEREGRTAALGWGSHTGAPCVAQPLRGRETWVPITSYPFSQHSLWETHHLSGCPGPRSRAGDEQQTGQPPIR